jgi:WD40 repeat protein
LCSAAGFAQLNANVPALTSNSAVAYVYVASSPNVDAFAAAADGRLTPVSGSPFPFNVFGMAASGDYLFGTDGVYIYTFSVASDGSIKQVASINAQQYNDPDNYGGPGSLFLDRTGATVYDTDFYCCGSDDAFQFFSLDQSTGGLNYLGVTTPTWSYYVPLSFMGSNVYAYASECSEYSAVFGFQRNNDGTLTALNINPALPVAPKGYSYCPNQLVAGPANHLAMALTPTNGTESPHSAPPPQLATYTADKSGNLTTNNTRFNMPKTAVSWITDIAMSPSGKLLAVGGTAGLQVFHFNGGKPITHYTRVLTKDEINQVFWDNDNHLYAISGASGKLFVFTVTPTSAKQAPGSPYAITEPQNIAVLSKK